MEGIREKDIGYRIKTFSGKIKLMKGEESMRNLADVIIIGSGLGGLFSAGLLGKAGYRVLVLEELDIVGGRYTTKTYKGFKVNTGSWALGIHGYKGPVIRTLRQLGAKPLIKVPGPPDRKTRIFGKDVDMPISGGFRTVISKVAKNKKEEDRVMAAIRRALYWQEPSDAMKLDEWMYSITDNKLIHGMFDFVVRAMTALNYYEIPAGEAFRLLRTFGQFKGVTTTVKDGNKGTVDALLEVMKKWPIKIMTQTKVNKIIVADGKIVGIQATQANGKSFEAGAKVILSNAGPKKTVTLAGRENFDTGTIREIDNIRPAKAATIIFAYDKPILDYDGFISFIDLPHITTVWEPHHLWPTYVPKGKYCMYAFSTMKTPVIEREIQLGIDECIANFPGLKDAEILTTLIFQNDWPIMHAGLGMGIVPKTTIEGLYNVGDGTNPSGWTCGEGVAVSVHNVVGDIFKRYPL